MIQLDVFASAHPARIASGLTPAGFAPERFASAHPARIASKLAYIRQPAVLTLPQHIPHGLHQQNRTDAMPQIHAICCELVDSFSDTAKAASALTIFPCSSTVKATYIAIIDSLGRTIDRFLGCESHRKSLLAYASPNPHAGWDLRQCGQSLNRLVMKPHKLRIISFKGFLIKVLQLGIVMLQ